MADDRDRGGAMEQPDTLRVKVEEAFGELSSDLETLLAELSARKVVSHAGRAVSRGTTQRAAGALRSARALVSEVRRSPAARSIIALSLAGLVVTVALIKGRLRLPGRRTDLPPARG
ncbi:MAG: hypothetical protein ACRDVP_05745 [Acidimicrobiales bacterium]